MDDDAKQCTDCKKTKPLLDFPRRKSSPDGHHWWCLDCKRAKDREYGAVYRARHPDQVRRNKRKYRRKEETRTKAGIANLLVKYGLTPEAFAAKLAAQGGRCPFCPHDADPPAVWDVDHDHSCCVGQQTCGGCLRDLLCHKHNLGLGYWDDDPAKLRAAADYIERWHAKITESGTTPWQHKGPRVGERSPAWQGDAASDNAMRLRLRKARGPAGHCANGCTDAKAYEWALADGGDRSDPASYIPLCHRCSMKHRGHVGSGHHNSRLTPEQIAEIRSRYVRGQKPTQWDLARQYGVGQAVISAIIRGESYRE